MEARCPTNHFAVDVDVRIPLVNGAEVKTSCGFRITLLESLENFLKGVNHSGPAQFFGLMLRLTNSKLQILGIRA